MPGEQFGFGIADVLFGTTAPQAKLPVTLPNVENEQRMTVHQYPGVPTKEFVLEANYTEKQIVGYRWYDKNKVTPAFPFGHGLSYGTFAFSDLAIKGRTISFKLTAASQSAGACETPQIYIGYPNADASAEIPVKVLRHFKKTCSSAATISYTLTDRDVSNWDVESKAWRITRGTYKVFVGKSSQDIQLEGTVTI